LRQPASRASSRFWRGHVALPAEHGAWVLLLGPLLIGLFAGGRWSIVSLYLIVAALCAFLARQPVTLAVKAAVGRRDREVLPAAGLWIAIYGAIGLLHVAGLTLRGFGYVLYLAIPAVPVFVWYLWLVSRREERRQWLVEILAAGALALAAPAAFWVGVGRPDPAGWLLWALTWAQSSASIVHAYLRLAQRGLGRRPAPSERWRLGRAALFVTSFNLAFAVGLGFSVAVPRLLAIPFALQWLETLWGITHPAVGLKPKAIGYRQLAISVLFTVLFILAWR
jgi:hypothetical protein